jgi:prepilin-type N-terminal cleavage/methylation domain-containing protein
MRGASNTPGFTLIELLIVIAIILILIAIALPNFLDAQIRAKYVKSAGDSRSLGIAAESFRVDRNMLLIDIWDDDNIEGVLRLQQYFGNIANPFKATRMQRDVMALTTPVVYTPKSPDPFLKDPKPFATEETWTGQLTPTPTDATRLFRTLPGPTTTISRIPRR